MKLENHYFMIKQPSLLIPFSSLYP